MQRLQERTMLYMRRASGGVLQDGENSVGKEIWTCGEWESKYAAMKTVLDKTLKRSNSVLARGHKQKKLQIWRKA